MVGSKSGTVNSRYETDEKTDANDGYIASESRISDYSQSRTTATTNQSGTKSPSLLSGYPTPLVMTPQRYQERDKASVGIRVTGNKVEVRMLTVTSKHG